MDDEQQASKFRCEMARLASTNRGPDDEEVGLERRQQHKRKMYDPSELGDDRAMKRPGQQSAAAQVPSEAQPLAGAFKYPGECSPVIVPVVGRALPGRRSLDPSKLPVPSGTVTAKRPAYPTIDVSSALHMLRDGEVRFTDEELNALRESFYKHPRKWLSIEAEVGRSASECRRVFSRVLKAEERYLTHQLRHDVDRKLKQRRSHVWRQVVARVPDYHTLTFCVGPKCKCFERRLSRGSASVLGCSACTAAAHALKTCCERKAAVKAPWICGACKAKSEQQVQEDTVLVNKEVKRIREEQRMAAVAIIKAAHATRCSK